MKRATNAVLTLIALPLVLGSCRSHTGGPQAGGDVFFPTAPVGDAYPAALISGRLEERDRCMFVASGGERWLLLWPEGYEARLVNGRVEVSDQNGKLVGRDGDEVSLGGGESRSSEVGGAAAAEKWATDLTGGDIPERCGDQYWIVARDS
ncbi:MAG TPA: hypothetical protein VGJ67_00800 [Actinomycetota bacterium]